MEDPDLHIRAIMKTNDFKTFYELPFDCQYNFFKMKDEKIKYTAILTIKDIYPFINKRIIEFDKTGILYLDVSISPPCLR